MDGDPINKMAAYRRNEPAADGSSFSNLNNEKSHRQRRWTIPVKQGLRDRCRHYSCCKHRYPTQNRREMILVISTKCRMKSEVN